MAITAAVLWPQSYHGGVRSNLINNMRLEAFGNRWGFLTWRGAAFVYWLESTAGKGVIGTTYLDVPIASRTMGFGINAAPTGVTPPGFSMPWARQGSVCVPIWFILFSGTHPADALDNRLEAPPTASATRCDTLRQLRLRPSRHAKPLPRMRHGSRRSRRGES